MASKETDLVHVDSSCTIYTIYNKAFPSPWSFGKHLLVIWVQGRILPNRFGSGFEIVHGSCFFYNWQDWRWRLKRPVFCPTRTGCMSSPTVNRSSSPSTPSPSQASEHWNQSWGRILGRNWDKFTSTNPFYPPPPSPNKKGSKLVCNVNIVHDLRSDWQCQHCNSLGFPPSFLRHSGIWGAADEAVLNKVKKNLKIPL